LLDLYEPEGAPAQRPACIAIHGGALREGDKAGPESVASVCQELAARGYVCASINHRMESDDAPAPGDTLRDRTLNAAIEDAGMAAHWLQRNAVRLRMDPRRMALLGRSSGAVVAMRVAYSKLGRELGIRAVLDMSGHMKGHLESIRKGDAPLCIIHGTNDTLVPLVEATLVAESARMAGVPYEIHLLEGRKQGHIMYFTREIGGVTLLQKTVGFFYRHLDLARH
jgi:acetyl esterase/lipase